MPDKCPTVVTEAHDVPSRHIAAIDTMAGVSITSPAAAEAYYPLLPSSWKEVAGFDGQRAYKVAGQVLMPILGVDVPVQVLEGYKGITLIGNPFVSLPGFSVSAGLVTLEGVGSIGLYQYHVALAALTGRGPPEAINHPEDYATAVGAIRGAEYTAEPLVADVTQPQKCHPSSLGIFPWSIATKSPVSYPQFKEDCRDPVKFHKWRAAFLRAQLEWAMYGVYGELMEVPQGAVKLNLKFVLKYKQVLPTDPVTFHVRPCVTEFRGSSELSEEELFTPGLSQTTSRVLTSVFLGLLDRGLDYAMACSDFQRAFLHSDPAVAEEVWRGTVYVVKVPLVWQGELRCVYLRLLLGVEGLQSSPIIFRKTAERIFASMGAVFSRIDSNLFHIHTPNPHEPAFMQWHGDDWRLIGPRAWVRQFITAVAKLLPTSRTLWLDPDTPVPFCGLTYTLHRTPVGWCIDMAAKQEYADKLAQSLPERLDASAGPQLRGQLGWLAGTVRPDLSIYARAPDAVLAGMGAQHLRTQVLASPGLRVWGVDITRPVAMTIYSDANLESRTITQLRAREAAIFFLDSPTGQPTIVDWYSRIHQRVVVDSNRAECRAFISAVDHACYVQHLLQWIADKARVALSLRMRLCTDSKSIIEFLNNPLASTTKLDYLVLAESATVLDERRWIPESENIADALTKPAMLSGPQYKLLRQLMMT
eukprot:jgi/Mesvir1/13321/Mv25522-RA.1